MDAWLVFLRIVHIVTGVFLIGNVFFMTMLLQPRLRALGPTIQMPVMGAILPVFIPAQVSAYIAVFASGVAMALTLRWNNLSDFFAAGWGWAIVVGLLATVAGGIVGFGIVAPTGMRLIKLGRGIQGRTPTPEEGKQMGQLASRLVTYSRVNVGIGVVIIGAMAAARFV